ncbi:germin-like protein subfamily T member 2 [Aristolochia californica]|uniref:germin-like protein subfamily T member 2 n=1 Tax=Aristolochia californica TaxID=171875 RepID=UPI0035D6A48D
MAAFSYAGSSLMFLIVCLTLAFLSPCHSDPDPLQDFCVADLDSKVLVNGFTCKPASTVTAQDFFFTGLAKQANTSANPFGANVTSANVLSFPGLNTLGLSMNRVDYAPGGLNIPHSHPRATELVLVLQGRLFVGFVSTGNLLFSKVVRPGEIFVIPKGLVHFQYNVGKGKALAITVFNSQQPGAVLLSPTLFGSKPTIPGEILAKAFQIDEQLVNDIKSKFGA